MNGGWTSSACAGKCWTRLRGAAVQASVPACDDFNRGDNEGVGYFEVNQKNGWRWNTANRLRPTCYARPNFELWNNAQVPSWS